MHLLHLGWTIVTLYYLGVQKMFKKSSDDPKMLLLQFKREFEGQIKIFRMEFKILRSFQQGLSYRYNYFLM